MPYFTDREPVIDIPWIGELSVAKLRWQAEVFRAAEDERGAAIADTQADLEAKYYEAWAVRESTMTPSGEAEPKWDRRFRNLRDELRYERDYWRGIRQFKTPGWVYEEPEAIAYPSDDELVAWLRSN